MWEAASSIQISDQAQRVGRPRVLLGGFPGLGFPARDGLEQAMLFFRELQIPYLYLPRVSRKRSKVRAFNPDVAIFYRTKIGPIEDDRPCLEELRCKKALWCCDLRPASALALPARGLFDHIFLPWSGSFNDPMYREGDCSSDAWRRSSRASVWYMPQASVLRSPIEYPTERRVVFIGDTKVKVHRNREELCQHLGVEMVNSSVREARLQIEARSQQLYSSSSYSLTTSPPVPGYTSIRTYNILCSGGLALLQHYPDCEKQFCHGQHALIFKSTMEARRVMSRYDKRPEARATIRRAGWLLAAQKHTMTHRLFNIMANMLDIDDQFWGYLE